MSLTVRRFELGFGAEQQQIDMPRRARILYVYWGVKKIALDCTVYDDADTKAFDLPHHRYFIVVRTGGLIPDGVYVGSVSLANGGTDAIRGAYHVYEVRGRAGA